MVENEKIIKEDIKLPNDILSETDEIKLEDNNDEVKLEDKINELYEYMYNTFS